MAANIPLCTCRSCSRPKNEKSENIGAVDKADARLAGLRMDLQCAIKTLAPAIREEFLAGAPTIRRMRSTHDGFIGEGWSVPGLPPAHRCRLYDVFHVSPAGSARAICDTLLTSARNLAAVLESLLTSSSRGSIHQPWTHVEDPESYDFLHLGGLPHAVIDEGPSELDDGRVEVRMRLYGNAVPWRTPRNVVGPGAYSKPMIFVAPGEAELSEYRARGEVMIPYVRVPPVIVEAPMLSDAERMAAYVAEPVRGWKLDEKTGNCIRE